LANRVDRKISVCSGTTLLAELMFQEISGRYKNFIHKAPVDFELVINLISPKFWSVLPDAQ